MSEIDFAAEFEAGAEPLKEADEMLPAIPKPPGPFDTTPAAKAILAFNLSIEALTRGASTIKIIKDESTQLRAAEYATTAKKVYKDMEALRHQFVDPHNAYLRSVNAMIKVYTDRLQGVVTSMSRLLNNYRILQENEKRKAQAEMEAEARRLEAEIQAEAQKSAEEGAEYAPVTVVVPVAPDVPKVARTETGAVHQRKKRRFEVVDESLLTRDYLCPDLKKIKEVVDAGVITDIPGVKIYEDYDTVIRV